MQKTIERTATEAVVCPSTYATILVHAESGLASSHRLEVAGRLARRLEARLIGLGAETFDPVLLAYGGYADGVGIALVQEQISKNLEAAETAFRRDAAGAEISWRTIQDYPHRAILSTARAVDLIVMSPRTNRGALQSADPADVVMGAGRPVLLVPDARAHLRAECVVVAWKDTRECRRAIADALPFLQRAEDVIVLAVVKPDACEAAAFETDDVVANLKRHGVDARSLVATAGHKPAEDEISRIATQNDADLIVAGAYGHSRVREWVVGGVTDSLLHRPGVFVLLSH